MKTLKSQVNKIHSIIDDLQSIECDLEKKMYAIEDNSNEKGREMTDRETKRFDEIKAKKSNVINCMFYLEYALSEIDNYF